MAVNDSASARLSTAMAKKTFSRISAIVLVKERLTRIEMCLSRVMSLILCTLWSVNIVGRRIEWRMENYVIGRGPWLFAYFHDKKDTVTAYKENDEIETGEHAKACNTAIGSNSIVHNGVPIFAG